MNEQEARAALKENGNIILAKTLSDIAWNAISQASWTYESSQLLQAATWWKDNSTLTKSGNYALTCGPQMSKSKFDFLIFDMDLPEAEKILAEADSYVVYESSNSIMLDGRFTIKELVAVILLARLQHSPTSSSHTPSDQPVPATSQSDE